MSIYFQLNKLIRKVNRSVKYGMGSFLKSRRVKYLRRLRKNYKRRFGFLNSYFSYKSNERFGLFLFYLLKTKGFSLLNSRFKKSNFLASSLNTHRQRQFFLKKHVYLNRIFRFSYNKFGGKKYSRKHYLDRILSQARFDFKFFSFSRTRKAYFTNRFRLIQKATIEFEDVSLRGLEGDNFFSGKMTVPLFLFFNSLNSKYFDNYTGYKHMKMGITRWNGVVSYKMPEFPLDFSNYKKYLFSRIYFYRNFVLQAFHYYDYFKQCFFKEKFFFNHIYSLPSKNVVFSFLPKPLTMVDRFKKVYTYNFYSLKRINDKVVISMYESYDSFIEKAVKKIRSYSNDVKGYAKRLSFFKRSGFLKVSLMSNFHFNMKRNLRFFGYFRRFFFRTAQSSKFFKSIYDKRLNASRYIFGNGYFYLVYLNFKPFLRFLRFFNHVNIFSMDLDTMGASRVLLKMFLFLRFLEFREKFYFFFRFLRSIFLKQNVMMNSFFSRGFLKSASPKVFSILKGKSQIYNSFFIFKTLRVLFFSKIRYANKISLNQIFSFKLNKMILNVNSLYHKFIFLSGLISNMSVPALKTTVEGYAFKRFNFMFFFFLKNRERIVNVFEKHLYSLIRFFYKNRKWYYEFFLFRIFSSGLFLSAFEYSSMVEQQPFKLKIRVQFPVLLRSRKRRRRSRM